MNKKLKTYIALSPEVKNKIQELSYLFGTTKNRAIEECITQIYNKYITNTK